MPQPGAAGLHARTYGGTRAGVLLRNRRRTLAPVRRKGVHGTPYESPSATLGGLCGAILSRSDRGGSKKRKPKKRLTASLQTGVSARNKANFPRAMQQEASRGQPSQFITEVTASVQDAYLAQHSGAERESLGDGPPYS
jgi:hypothetical protein